VTEVTTDVDRLTLRLHGLSWRDGEAVARLVADGLAEAGGWRSTDDVQSQVTAEGAPIDIARSILVELRRHLEADR
jgi:hypothetical protein